MATDTQTQATPDLGKLVKQQGELRAAMMESLGKADDNTTRKLSHELATVNRQILDIEATSQGDARTTYMDSIYDALNTFEFEGLELTVRYNVEDGDVTPSVVFKPTDDTINAIAKAIKGIDRPSSATKWTYSWEDGDDGKRHQSFDFGKGTTKRVTGSNGTRTVGWTTPEGASITLGDAFDAIATTQQKAELASKSGGSATNAFKVKTIEASGYKKN